MTLGLLIRHVIGIVLQDATLSQEVPRDAAVNFGATGINDIKKPMDRHITTGNASSKVR